MEGERWKVEGGEWRVEGFWWRVKGGGILVEGGGWKVGSGGTLADALTTNLTFVRFVFLFLTEILLPLHSRMLSMRCTL